jgi:hypothetical protein
LNNGGRRERSVGKGLDSPGAQMLGRLEPALWVMPAGTVLSRVYFTSSGHPMAWRDFRSFGPLNFRWDHLRSTAAGAPCEQERGVLYAAATVLTSLAEAFQVTRRIDRGYQTPWLVVFKTLAPVVLVDLTGDFAIRMQAPMALQSGSRVRARAWARDLYEAYDETQGILYASPAGGGPAVVLNERASRAPFFPPHPEFNRALADDLLLDPLRHAAQALGYALR